MTDLKPLEAFVLAMRHGSLSAAEAQSGIPKATLSRLIARLEEKLATQLFLRAARRAVPTEAGSQFYLRAQRMLDQVNADFDEARALLQNLNDEVAGKLRISRKYALCLRHPSPDRAGRIAARRRGSNTVRTFIELSAAQARHRQYPGRKLS